MSAEIIDILLLCLVLHLFSFTKLQLTTPTEWKTNYFMGENSSVTDCNISNCLAHACVPQLN